MDRSFRGNSATPNCLLSFLLLDFSLRNESHKNLGLINYEFLIIEFNYHLIKAKKKRGFVDNKIQVFDFFGYRV